MHDEMQALLNTYLDGELQGSRLLEMKRHLAECEPCREELKELRLVSELLQAAPAPEFLPAERFASNLVLSLPRRNLHDLPSKSGSLIWWLVPAGLMGAWIFVQTLFTLTGMVTVAQITGLLGNAIKSAGGGTQTLWYTAVTGLFGSLNGGTQSGLSLLNSLDISAVDLLKGFLWQALIALLYWGWLLVWWFQRRPQPMQLDNAS